MHNLIALALLLLIPAAFGQMQRGSPGTRFSGLHNHFAVPIDGGQLYAWDMNTTGASLCTAGNNNPTNISTFTGSAVAAAHCGGVGTTPSIGSKGMVFAANTDMSTLNAQPSFSSSWTLASASVITSATAESICTTINANSTNPRTVQYVGYFNMGAADLEYVNSGTGQNFQTTATPVSTNSWHVTVWGYTSTSASSARVWVDKVSQAGTWTIGTGTAALPAGQANAYMGNTQLNGGTDGAGCIGTIGYTISYDHNINASAQGFIYYAFQRAMLFRNVSLP